MPFWTSCMQHAWKGRRMPRKGLMLSWCLILRKEILIAVTSCGVFTFLILYGRLWLRSYGRDCTIKVAKKELHVDFEKVEVVLVIQFTQFNSLYRNCTSTKQRYSPSLFVDPRKETESVLQAGYSR